MKSYINRQKNFSWITPTQIQKIINSKIKENLIKEELYLWSWCETLLRYYEISKSKK